MAFFCYIWFADEGKFALVRNEHRAYVAEKVFAEPASLGRADYRVGGEIDLDGTPPFDRLRGRWVAEDQGRDAVAVDMGSAGATHRDMAAFRDYGLGLEFAVGGLGFGRAEGGGRALRLEHAEGAVFEEAHEIGQARANLLDLPKFEGVGGVAPCLAVEEFLHCPCGESHSEFVGEVGLFVRVDLGECEFEVGIVGEAEAEFPEGIEGQEVEGACLFDRAGLADCSAEVHGENCASVFVAEC